jgi:hypothetical protein
LAAVPLAAMNRGSKQYDCPGEIAPPAGSKRLFAWFQYIQQRLG